MGVQKQIPERLTNFMAYRNGNEFIAPVDVELPSIEAMTDTVSGAGLAGESETPTIGHFGSMVTTINWRTIEKVSLTLARQEVHHLDFRGSFQTLNTASGNYDHVPLKVTIRGIPKVITLGTLSTGAATENSNELETTYIKILLDGYTLLEIDKYNFICVIDGVDYMAKIRANLGL